MKNNMSKLMILVHTVNTEGLSEEQKRRKIDEVKAENSISDESGYYDIKNIFLEGIVNNVECVFPKENMLSQNGHSGRYRKRDSYSSRDNYNKY